MAKVEIVQYRWAGKWGPFRITSHCEECSLVKALIESLIERKFAGDDVTFEVKPWLDNWIYCIKRLVYPPPIIIINGKATYQYWKKLPDMRGIEQTISAELAKST